MATCFIVLSGVKRLLIGATLPGMAGRRQVLYYSSRNIWQAAINTTRYPALASSFWKPAVARIVFSPSRSSSSSFCKVKMVNSVDAAPAPNGCDNNGHTAQEVLVDTASFKEIKIPLSWGHLAGNYTLLISLFYLPAFSCFLL